MVGSSSHIPNSLDPPKKWRSRIPIVINYAYDGFLYFPLFLAHSWGYLPPGTELHLAGSDENAMALLQNHPPAEEKLVLSICDPLVRIPSATSGAGRGDKTCIVGTFICGLPLWLINKDPAIRTIAREADIQQYCTQFKALISYKEGTTINVLANRLREQHPMPNVRTIIQCEFGEEFQKLSELWRTDQTTAEEALVFTSDILQVLAFHKGENDVVFSYAEHARTAGLSPYLFTGIATRESMLRAYLPEVVGVLSGLRNATRLARSLHARKTKELLEVLSRTCDFFNACGFQGSEEDKVGIFREAIHDLVIRANVYRYLEDPPDAPTLAEAWRASEQVWKEYSGEPDRAPLHIEEHSSPIPSLLIHERWEERLNGHYRNVFSNPHKHFEWRWILLSPIYRTTLLPLVTIIATIFSFGFSLYMTRTSTSQHPFYFDMSCILAAVMLIDGFAAWQLGRESRKLSFDVPNDNADKQQSAERQKTAAILSQCCYAALAFWMTLFLGFFLFQVYSIASQ